MRPDTMRPDTLDHTLRIVDVLVCDEHLSDRLRAVLERGVDRELDAWRVLRYAPTVLDRERLESLITVPLLACSILRRAPHVADRERMESLIVDPDHAEHVLRHAPAIHDRERLEGIAGRRTA